MNAVEEIRYHDELYAIIIRREFREPGVRFFTSADLSQQLASIGHPAGHTIAAHFHPPVTHQVRHTLETLVIQEGKLRVDFFDETEILLGSQVLSAGDTVLLIKGGHGIEVLEDLRMIEVKQGPYDGDKIHFKR